MKDNIESKNIGNRKFIIELRYDPVASMLDKKGTLVERIQSSKMFQTNHWEIGQSEIIVRDHKERDEAKNIAVVTFNKLSYISYKVDSIESYYSTFSKLYDEVINILGELSILRIGCRIIGTYVVKSKDYSSILNAFISSFPGKFSLSQYPAKDMLFHLQYENGMYEIGPLKDDDDFYRREFNMLDCKKHVGVAIDTDNYLTNEARNINSKSLIKDIYILSLSVEKDLYTNFADF